MSIQIYINKAFIYRPTCFVNDMKNTIKQNNSIKNENATEPQQK